MPPRSIIVGTAGHIDHGKTRLLRALTGIDTDRLPEEKLRGITIDIGFAHLDLGEFRLGIIDVPGHERFIRNMLAGSVGVELALLVVAADDSVMPQTREHLTILQLLGLRHGVIALTKCDRAESDWIDAVTEEISELVQGSFLEGAPVVRTAAPGDGPASGLEELRAALSSVCRQIPVRAAGDIFRMPVDRSFNVKGRGTVVTGTVWSGEASVGAELAWQPLNKSVHVRGLQAHGHEVEAVSRGQRAALNLPAVRHSEIHRGHELATPGFLKSSRVLSVDLRVASKSPRELKHRSTQRLHVGTQEVNVTVSLFEGTALLPGNASLAQLFCSEPVMAVNGQPFVLRTESPLSTIGGGRVLQPVARRLGRRQADGLHERLRLLGSLDPSERAAAAIYFYGMQAWTELDLCRDANLSRREAPEMLAELAALGTVLVFQGGPERKRRVHRDVLENFEARMLKVVAAMHAEQPLRKAFSREQMLSRCPPRIERWLLAALLDRLVAQRGLVEHGQNLALPGFAPQLTAAQAALIQKTLQAFGVAGFQPPAPAELATLLGTVEESVLQSLAVCEEAGEVVHLGGEIYLHRQHEVALRRCVGTLLEGGQAASVSQIREAIGTTRKYAVPMCEYLDRIGFTERHGDARSLAKASRDVG